MPTTPPQAEVASERPRAARARQAILEAADDLLVERGFAGVTIEGIAERAGVAKQTIYRWWPSKVELLMDSLIDDAEDEFPGADTGTLAGDVKEHLIQLASFLTKAPSGRVLSALIGQAQHDSRVAEQLAARYQRPRRQRDLAIIARAVERGELGSTIDAGRILDALEGPVYLRAIITHEDADEEFIDFVVGRVLPRTNPKARGRERRT